MASKMIHNLLFLLFLTYLHLTVDVSATTIRLVNRCGRTIWPGIQPGGGKPIVARGGFQLNAGQSYSLNLPPFWSGRIWGRDGCSFNPSGQGRCASGDCGGLYCEGRGGQPPATLFEVTVAADKDYYDVSLVDGYNLPMSVYVTGGCPWVGCVKDLNNMCPNELRVWSGERIVGCKSACMTFNTDLFCCRGAWGTPDKCKPTNYSRLFKNACPHAYSYAYDDQSSLMTCNRGNYVVNFC
ncbi:hypothetical protein QQ045_006175 [Rhodiola kirilowii]